MDVDLRSRQLLAPYSKALAEARPTRAYTKTALSEGDIEFKASLIGAGRDVARLLIPRRRRRRRSSSGNNGDANPSVISGGRELGRRIRTVERVRCPAGTQNGGRFSSTGLAGCGPRVSSRSESRAADSSRKLKKRRANLLSTARGEGDTILLRGRGATGSAVQIRRSAQIRKG